MQIGPVRGDLRQLGGELGGVDAQRVLDERAGAIGVRRGQQADLLARMELHLLVRVARKQRLARGDLLSEARDRARPRVAHLAVRVELPAQRVEARGRERVVAANLLAHLGEGLRARDRPGQLAQALEELRHPRVGDEDGQGLGSRGLAEPIGLLVVDDLDRYAH